MPGTYIVANNAQGAYGRSDATRMKPARLERLPKELLNVVVEHLRLSSIIALTTCSRTLFQSLGIRHFKRISKSSWHQSTIWDMPSYWDFDKAGERWNWLNLLARDMDRDDEPDRVDRFRLCSGCNKVHRLSPVEFKLPSEVLEIILGNLGIHERAALMLSSKHLLNRLGFAYIYDIRPGGRARMDWLRLLAAKRPGYGVCIACDRIHHYTQSYHSRPVKGDHILPCQKQQFRLGPGGPGLEVPIFLIHTAQQRYRDNCTDYNEILTKMNATRPLLRYGIDRSEPVQAGRVFYDFKIGWESYIEQCTTTYYYVDSEDERAEKAGQVWFKHLDLDQGYHSCYSLWKGCLVRFRDGLMIPCARYGTGLSIRVHLPDLGGDIVVHKACIFATIHADVGSQWPLSHAVTASTRKHAGQDDRLLSIQSIPAHHVIKLKADRAAARE